MCSTYTDLTYVQYTLYIPLGSVLIIVQKQPEACPENATNDRQHKPKFSEWPVETRPCP